MWELYWLARKSTPGDHPVSLHLCLQLAAQLEWGMRDMVILALIPHMDAAYQKWRAVRIESDRQSRQARV